MTILATNFNWDIFITIFFVLYAAAVAYLIGGPFDRHNVMPNLLTILLVFVPGVNIITALINSTIVAIKTIKNRTPEDRERLRESRKRRRQRRRETIRKEFKEVTDAIFERDERWYY